MTIIANTTESIAFDEDLFSFFKKERKKTGDLQDDPSQIPEPVFRMD
jgi:hypothetical protein